jgi:microcystin-dependent protein
MSIILDRLLEQAATMLPATVAFSPEDVTVLLYASEFLEKKNNWLDEREDPLDEITDEQWDTIEKMVASVYEQIMNPLIGLCFPVVIGTIPDNCLWLDGATYDRADYPQLYDMLDATFVLDADTFFLPDMRSRLPIGAGEGTGLSEYAVGETGGEEEHTLTTGEMPSHQHGIFTTNGLALAPGELPVKVPFILAADTTDLAGGGGAHNNIPPFLALQWAVVAL